MTDVRTIIYPDLARLPARERTRVLGEARQSPLDLFELFGIAVGLIGATALTRYGVDGLSISGRVALALANLLVAMPLLALLVGPFHVRRMRRGLRAELRRRAALLGGVA